MLPVHICLYLVNLGPLTSPDGKIMDMPVETVEIPSTNEVTVLV
jgi:hypothetical protein